MKSIAFPTFLNNVTTKVVEDREATMSNYKLLLQSLKKDLFGDPYFGTNLERFLFSQGDPVLKDALIEDIYVATRAFMPQISLTRKDIDVIVNKTTVTITVKGINLIDYEPNLFEINLTGKEESE